MSSDDLKAILKPLIRPLADRLWGAGNVRKGATKTEVRYGEQRTINPQKGSFWDHGSGKGGGVLDLVIYEGKATTHGEAMTWLRDQDFDVPAAGGQSPAGSSNRSRSSDNPPAPDSNRSFGPEDDAAGGEPAKRKKEIKSRKLAKVYDYVDEGGTLLYQTMRYDLVFDDGSPGKTFSQRRRPRPEDEPESIRDGWVYSLAGCKMVPYRLPELIAAIAAGSRIFFVEGEKCVDRLWEDGIPATCNPMGAGKWWQALNQYFAGADICILPDNDPQQKDQRTGEPRFHADGRPVLPGWDHACAVFKELRHGATAATVLKLPGLALKGDVFDWLAAGGTPEGLYELAAKAGPPPLPAFVSQFNATWFHEIGKQKPKRDWLIKNLILAGCFGIAYGPPGCGKSFLMADMMLTCAAGALNLASRPEWFGYMGRPFGVVYVVAEGREDFEIRLHAWRAENKIPADAFLPFVFLPTTIDMRSNDADTKKLAIEIAGLSAIMEERCGISVGAVVIDTVARALAGGNENDSAVMGAFVINCGKLQTETKVAVLGVHHGGKEAGRGPRGHEGLHGAADVEIEVIGATAETPNVWAVRKLKAGPAGKNHRFRLRQRTVGDDADGDPITSCIVVNQAHTEAAAAGGQAEPDKGLKVYDAEMELLQVLGKVIDERGVMPPPDLPVARGVTLVAAADEVRKAFSDRYMATEGMEVGSQKADQNMRQRWSRSTKKMIRFGIIESKQPWIWFTGKKVKGLRLRGIQEETASHISTAGLDGDPGALPDDLFDDDVTEFFNQ